MAMDTFASFGIHAALLKVNSPVWPLTHVDFEYITKTLAVLFW